MNRVRLGNQTTEDISVLSSRITQQPLDCLHIFPTNQQVHDFNDQKLLQISDTATITIHSHDQLSVQGKRKLHIPENRHLTGGLHSVLRLAVGARVSIVKNLDISDGLVNGANGSISAIRLNKDHPLDGVIMVKFENEQIGKSARSTLPLSLQSEGVPITVTTSRFSLGSESTVVVNRTQYPLTLAWAATIHKVQGQTVEQVSLSFEGARFTAGQAYVGLSRVKSLSGLHLTTFDDKKIKVNRTALLEMERLRSSRHFPWHPSIQIDDLQLPNKITVVHLNIRSYNAHKDDIKADKTMQAAHVIGLTETYSCNVSLDQYTTFSKQSQHGVADFVKNSIPVVRRKSMEMNNILESIVIYLPDYEITIAVCYIKPGVSQREMTQMMQLQTELISCEKVILMGYFNMDLLSQIPLVPLSEPFFKQHILSPTHRDGGLLDHIYTRKVHVDKKGTIYTYYSDHLAVFIQITVSQTSD